jgi:hypothetical protein
MNQHIRLLTLLFTLSMFPGYSGEAKALARHKQSHRVEKLSGAAHRHLAAGKIRGHVTHVVATRRPLHCLAILRW